MRLPGSRKRSKRRSKTDEEPEPATAVHQMVTAMREANVPRAVCATLLGVSRATVGRHQRPAPARSQPPRVPRESACARAREIVRATHGLVGAASLAKTCSLPRRAAAAIKQRELREMECERKARCGTVIVQAPGIIRGFDAMHVDHTDGKAYWLVAADAAVPYRTSIATVRRYDAAHVIAALAADFEQHGAPVVLRLDRIACQRTPEVRDLLAAHQVLPLHGPPRHPYYYGQLERQNREHRAWQAVLGRVNEDALRAAAEAMRTALNTLWARPTLDWCTAEDAWRARPPVHIDRRTLINDVSRRTAGLMRAGLAPLTAERVATETALIERGLLTIHPGRQR